MLERLNKIHWFWFVLVLLMTHIWSVAGVTWPIINLIGFGFIVLLCLILALVDMRLALLLFILELIIGSKGYIFSFEIGGLALSLRIALWLVIMSVWSAKFVLNFKNNIIELKDIVWSVSGKFWLVIGLACVFSVTLAYGKNILPNIFFDANNWVFLLIALPIWFNFKTKADLDLIAKIFLVGVAWLSIETLMVGYIFSHNVGAFGTLIYHWLRRTGLAEITWTPNGFWRVFLQSQIFLVVALLGLMIKSTDEKNEEKRVITIIFKSSVLFAALFFSLSRSLWLGLIVGLLMVVIVSWPYWKRISNFLITGVLGLCVAYLLVWLMFVTSFGGKGSSLDALVDRANVTTEAAASSRWNLLPVVWSKIMINPIFGQGFGATVIYQSKDPRILEKNSTGLFETYAFEWGWLDFWLKLGLWGVLAYLLWLWYLIRGLFKLQTFAGNWLAISLIAVAVIHFFTPYLNHPLGLIIVIISALALKIWSQTKQLA